MPIGSRGIDTAKLFWTGRSQAVRLPRTYGINGDAVRIRGAGAAVVLEPLPVSWAWLDRLQPVDNDFLDSGRDQPPPQPRALFDAA